MEFYTDNFMLNRAYDKLNNNHVEEKAKFVKPLVSKLNNKVCVSNFSEFCASVKRTQQNLTLFLCSELSTTCSITENGCLIINGKFKSEPIINTFKKYINNMVKCSSCQSFDTNLIKKNRIEFINCNHCKSEVALEKKN